MILLASLAYARPTDGTGMWYFDDTDVVAYVDSPGGTARVYYSTAGTNEVRAGDDDADGIPDFAEEVAAATEDVLTFYAAAGFRPPLTDDGRGGSDAMDVYLLDFAGSADGNFAQENCSRGSPMQCSGYFQMENDFTGYGYSSISTAIRVLTSHELFHAVQAAYDAGEDVWFSEGTAVWAEELYDPETEDFLYFSDAYLEDTTRSLDEPPAGPVPTFAYATGLWWYFLSSRYGDGVMVSLLEASETSDDILADMAAIEEANGGTLADDFATFARWNLATGEHAGTAESYPFAAEIGPPEAEATGGAIGDDNRYYPLAATYYKLRHSGGEIWFATAADAPELAFSLHAQAEDGKTSDALATFAGSATPKSLGEFEAGDYWIVGSNPTLAENSTKVVTCVGRESAMGPCAPADTGDTGDTGGGAEEPGKCGCQAGGGSAGIAGMLAAGVLVRTRRRRHSGLVNGARHRPR